ncbi:hypothetical protein HUJ05_012218 [Dendroctonus ponderosae]|nr:hypothetical protein HUJ05_012218 [Dendroctonus ponderosae]
MDNSVATVASTAHGVYPLTEEDSDGRVGSISSGTPDSYWPESDSMHSDEGLASGRFPFFGSPRLPSDYRNIPEFFGKFFTF